MPMRSLALVAVLIGLSGCNEDTLVHIDPDGSGTVTFTASRLTDEMAMLVPPDPPEKVEEARKHYRRILEDLEQVFGKGTVAWRDDVRGLKATFKFKKAEDIQFPRTFFVYAPLDLVGPITVSRLPNGNVEVTAQSQPFNFEPATFFEHQRDRADPSKSELPSTLSYRIEVAGAIVNANTDSIDERIVTVFRIDSKARRQEYERLKKLAATPMKTADDVKAGTKGLKGVHGLGLVGEKTRIEFKPEK